MSDHRKGRERPCWVFGYGSLIWRTGFPYVEARPAFTRGFTRRFWQGSTDHRGVPGRPGRVVTLVRETMAVCHGRAYLLDPAGQAAVLAHLDDREVGGYERLQLTLTLEGGDTVDGLTWVAWPGNANYLGPASAHAIAEQVVSAAGPSGCNSEYVLRLEESLRQAGATDPHVAEIASLVRGIQRSQAG